MPHFVDRFGGLISQLALRDPAAARRLLLAGYRAKGVQLRFAPDRALSPARQYLARICMDSIIAPLTHPGDAALVNIFMPCELLQAFGLTPMFAEAMACYLNGASAEKAFLDHAEASGVPETLCSYHKVLLGAALSGVIPKPLFTACTSLACDANNLTFRKLAEHYGIPQFYLDVPYARDADAVAEVADGLRELAAFLEDVTHRRLDEAALRASVGRTGRSLELLQQCQRAKAGKYLPNDVTSELYEVFVTHTLLGTPQVERYAELLKKDLDAAKPGGGIRILWMHTIPFFQPPVRELLNLNSRVQLVACDMNLDVLGLPMDAEKPFESMARRLVYNSFNGSARHRIGRALEAARLLGADGVVYFSHWGCKQTQGAAQLVRQALEAEGYPVLLLDGDGCDRANTSDGQTSTRLGAFVELLETRKQEARP